MSSASRARQLERLKGQLGGGGGPAATGHDRLFGGIGGASLPRLLEVPLAELRPSPHQPRKRFDPEALASLAASIERHGLLQPVVVRRRDDGQGGFELVAGERRLRAFERLGRAAIPALLSTGDAEELALIENIQREDLHPLEEAAAVARLMERHGWTQEAVGRAIGKPRTTVGEIVALNALPGWLRAEAEARPVARHLLVQVGRIADPAGQRAAWEAVKDGASVRALKARRRAATAGAGEGDRSSATVAAVAAARRGVEALARLPAAALAGPDAAPRAALLELRRAIDRLLEPPPEG